MTTVLDHFARKRVIGSGDCFGDVFNPNTGVMAARVPLAGTAEVHAVVADAAGAQRKWARWNPQRRARVLVRFLQLANDELEPLARLLVSEHGKAIADARGDM